MNEEPASAAAAAAAPSKHFLEQWIEDDVLAGRTGGKVVTRFPPEPNGYLHIGHAKAICVDFGMAKKFGGECHLRLDDTNPSKESDEFAENIKTDIRWLGFDWGEHFYSAADLFDTMYEIAENLVKAGQAYVCFLSQEEWKKHRGIPTEPGIPSPWRDTSPEENLARFHDMRDGKYEDGECCLRAKIDMASPNIHFRDPVIYRIMHTSHYHLGDKWCVYPMYDFAHPIEDALEGVTHSMCTLEFEVHRPLYDWVVDRMDEMGMLVERGGVKIRPHQREFSRLNITYTVMSKRKLLQLVKEGLVAGWDDPRMPTLCGLRRRGYTPQSIKNFIEDIGYTKYEALNDIGLLEHNIREELNHHANRVSAVLNPVKVVITNYPEDKVEMMEMDNNPEQEGAGRHQMPFSRELYIERDDFMEEPPKKFFRLTPGKEVRLKGAYIIMCTGCTRDADGNVTEIQCTYDPDTLSGSEGSQRKVKGTLHWVSARHCVDAEVRLYDRLFAVENPSADTEYDFRELLNPDSLRVIPDAKIEPFLAQNAQVGDTFQFQRIGYFTVDQDTTEGHLVFNRTIGLKDSWAKQQGK